MYISTLSVLNAKNIELFRTEDILTRKVVEFRQEKNTGKIQYREYWKLALQSFKFKHVVIDTIMEAQMRNAG